MTWHYRVKAPDETLRDPIQGEFFSTEAIKNPADALVREAVQNAMDATLRDDDGQPRDIVRVRFFLATGKHALPGKEAADWFDGAWEHFQASGSGLREPPSKGEACPYLVFEDFNTIGLKGDISQSEPIDGVQNHFFYFFRAEGKSVEGGKERGRWGVGKHVFPRSSRANTFFGLSVRADDGSRVFMGHSVFKSHRVGGGYFCPDGYPGASSFDLFDKLRVPGWRDCGGPSGMGLMGGMGRMGLMIQFFCPCRGVSRANSQPGAYAPRLHSGRPSGPMPGSLARSKECAAPGVHIYPFGRLRALRWRDHPR
jgi:hypothetical protein